MLKRSLLLCTLALGVATLSSCIFDPKQDDGPPPVDNRKFQDLSERVHVLENLELAYNRRTITKYDELLDVNFTFHYTDGDVGGGGVPVQWDRAEEVLVNTRLFDPNYSGANRCKSIFMDVRIEDGLKWSTVEANDGSGEEWFTTTLFYNFSIKAEPDTEFIPLGDAKADYTVRNAGTPDAPQWRLVEMRDRGGS